MRKGAAVLFSVVIPVYNAARYLEECAASLTGQKDFLDFELIFVDDGSTDSCPEMLDTLALQHPEKVRVIHTPNRGSVLARKKGIDAAEGDFVLFCDADDRYMPECMETVCVMLQKTEADVLIWNFRRFTEKGPEGPNAPVFADGTVFEGEGKKTLYRELLSGWRLNTLWNKAIRRNLLQSDPTDFEKYADNPMSDDLLMSLWPLTKAKRVAWCGKVLYEYRVTPGGLTQTFDERRYLRATDPRVREKLRSCLPAWGMDTEEYRVLFAKRCLLDRIDVAMSAFRRASDAEAERIVLNRNWFKSLPVHPGETGKAVSALSVKSRVQYELIRIRCRLLLHLLAGKAGK